MLFDNHEDGCPGSPSGTSRGIEIELFDATNEFDIIESYDTATNCDKTGSAYDMLPGGNVVLACSSTDSFYEFSTSGETTEWEMELDCSTMDPAGTLYRGRPVQLPVEE